MTITLKKLSNTNTFLKYQMANTRPYILRGKLRSDPDLLIKNHRPGSCWTKSPIPTPQPCIIKLTIHVHQMNFQSSYIPNTVQFVWDETCKIQSDDQTNILIKPLQDQTRWVWITNLKCVHEALSNYILTIYKWTRLIEHTEQSRSSKAEW